MKLVLPFRLRERLLAVVLVCFCPGCGESYRHHSASMSHSTIQNLVWGTVTVKMPDGTTEQYKDCVITPKGSMPWDYKRFGSDLKRAGDPDISHLHPEKPKEERGTGILPYAIEKLLQGVSNTNTVVIVSQGMRDMLGVNPSTETHLKNLKERGEIEDFYLLNSKEVPERHNSCVKAGKEVYTLLHSTC